MPPEAAKGLSGLDMVGGELQRIPNDEHWLQLLAIQSMGESVDQQNVVLVQCRRIDM